MSSLDAGNPGIRSLWVPGMPRPKPRPRLGARGNVYTPDTGWEDTIAAAWIDKYGKEPYEGMVTVDIVFELGKDLGTSIVVTPVEPDNPEGYAAGAFDLDNGEKAILDALSPDQSRQTRILSRRLGIKPRGLAWDNDSQVVSLQAVKRFTKG